MGSTTKFLDIANSDLKIVNNSLVKNVINVSFNTSTAVTEVSIGYEEDLERLEKNSSWVNLFHALKLNIKISSKAMYYTLASLP